MEIYNPPPSAIDNNPTFTGTVTFPDGSTWTSTGLTTAKPVLFKGAALIAGSPQTSGSTDTAINTRIQGSSNGTTYGLTLDSGWSNASSVNTFWMQSRSSANFATNIDIWINPNGGNVAIGTTTSQTQTLFVNGTSATNTTFTAGPATAPVVNGSSAFGLLLSSTATLGLYCSAGAPTFTAAQGSICINTTGSSIATRLYVNTTGSTTWTNFVSAA